MISEATTHLERGVRLSKARDYQGAVAELDRAIDLDPTLADAWAERGYARMKLGQHEDAIADHDRAIALSPDRGVYFHLRGIVYEHTGAADRPKVIADCTRAIELPNPRVTEAYNSRGAMHWLDGDVDEAVADWKRAIDADPTYHKPYVNLASVHRLRGELAPAAALLEEALRHEPHNADVFFERALLRNETEPDLAAVDLDHAIALDPAHLDARNNRAALRLAAGDPERALEDLETLPPSDPDVLSNRAIALLQLGRLDEALPACDAAVAADPGRADLLGLRAAIHFAAGELDRAEVELERAIRIDPDDEELKENWDILRRALAERAGQA